MTNAKKFEDVFGFEPNYSGCITAKCSNCPLYGTTVLGHCNTDDWWNSEYKDTHIDEEYSEFSE